MKIAYLTDSSISIAKNDDFFKGDDTFLVPLHVNVDGIDYLDDENMPRLELIEKMKTAKKVSTSQPSPAEVETILDRIMDLGYDVLVCACIASGLSGTQNLVYSCAIEKKLAIVNLDSKGAGPCEIHALKMFKKEINNGSSLLDAQAKVQHMLDVSHSYAIVDDLTFLQRGGRISGVSAGVGTLLKIKPIVQADKSLNGKVVNIDKVRTRKKSYHKVIEIAYKDIDPEEYFCVIGSFGSDDDAKELQDLILEKYPSTSVSIMDLCFAVGAHTGPNTLAVFLTRK